MCPSRQTRTIGLDKPCPVCGKPVHHTYSALTDGVCGSCADKRRPAPPKGIRPYHRAMVLRRGGPDRPASATEVAVKICIAIAVGVAAVMTALRLLVG